MKTFRVLALFILVAVALRPASPASAASPLGPAGRLMAQCERALWALRLQRGDADLTIDPGRSGLIGPDMTALTTSLGRWGDKVASIRPEMADAMVVYLRRAGLAAGDWIGVNGSGSFPGFLLAVLCAAQSEGLQTQLVYSYGASCYGSTDSKLTFPVLLDFLRARGLLTTRLRAVSSGGA